MWLPSQRAVLWMGLLSLTLLTGTAHAIESADVAAPMTDQQLFEKFDLTCPGLEKFAQAVRAKNWDDAKRELAAYYRTRTGTYSFFDPHHPAASEDEARKTAGAGQALIDRTGSFDQSLWATNNTFDFESAQFRMKERMYFFEGLGRAVACSDDPRMAQALMDLVRSWVQTYPRDKGSKMWATMSTGIRMRSGWPVAFLALSASPAVSDDDIVLFLKTAWDQSNYLLHNHNQTSNWLTFEMAGLYTSGVTYPEFAEAAAWRRFACETALKDLTIGWLPDGMSIELTPGYGQFFSNYYVIYDLARHVGRLEEFGMQNFPAGTEPLYNLYLKIMTPDRSAPTTNDNGPVNVVDILNKALERFPDRQDFRWVTTDGREGSPPDYTSVYLPYAGYAAMRSGWGRQDHMLYFDAGPVGYRHAHQDKLEVMIWAYGRQVLFDPGRQNYDETPLQNYCMDTHSHNTVMVDHRPQRRKWYNDPHPDHMPYQKLDNVRWESDEASDFAAGVYDENYGLPGVSNAYPYSSGSDFGKGWGTPATHYRRVLFFKPDIFLVADTLVSKDGQSHQYDARWHLDSVRTVIADDHVTVTTADADQPNLQIVPLERKGLTIKTTSAQESPEILGWKVVATPQPATTLQHFKSGSGTVQYLTLFLPLKSGQKGLVDSVQQVNAMTWHVQLNDGRKLTIKAPPSPGAKLSVELADK